MCRRLPTLDSASGTCDVETHHIAMVFKVRVSMICTVQCTRISSYELDLDEFYDVELFYQPVLIIPRQLPRSALF
jgi:hypothetical protein